MNYPTSERDGAISNATRAHFEAVAKRLADLEREYADPFNHQEYRDLLGIYLALAGDERNRFSGRRA